jgi:hypothetical protein
MRPPRRDAHLASATVLITHQSPSPQSSQLPSPHPSLLPIFAKQKSGEDRTRAGWRAEPRAGAQSPTYRAAPSTAEHQPSF